MTKEEKRKEYQKNYRLKNAVKIKQQKKEYFQKNKIKIREQKKKYKEENPEKVELQKEYTKNWKKNHPDKVKQYRIDNADKEKIQNKEWRKNHPERSKEYCEKWRKNNLDKFNKGNKKWKQNNKEKVKLSNKKYAQKKRKNCLQYNIKNRMSCAIRGAIKRKGKIKENSILELLPYSIKELEQHLISTLPTGYNIDDIFKNKILDIDHIIPQSAYKYVSTNDIDFINCWALKNLRFLSRKENCIKNNNVDWNLIEQYNLYDILPKSIIDYI